MVLANQNAKLTDLDQSFLVSPLVLTRESWERGWFKHILLFWTYSSWRCSGGPWHVSLLFRRVTSSSEDVLGWPFRGCSGSVSCCYGRFLCCSGLFGHVPVFWSNVPFFRAYFFQVQLKIKGLDKTYKILQFILARIVMLICGFGFVTILILLNVILSLNTCEINVILNYSDSEIDSTFYRNVLGPFV
jgi:hypothetical protein